MKEKPNFIGWATRNNLKCADGRTIMKDAFIGDDGKTVPLVWHHQYDSPDNILGHALLQNCADGVKAFGFFNDTEAGQLAKKLVEHGDIKQLSIFANQLKHAYGRNVIEGCIKEVSLVPSSANPGANITDVIMHSSEAIYLNEDEGVITTDELIVPYDESLSHADDPKDDPKKDPKDDSKDDPKDDPKKDPKKDPKDDSKDEETLKDILDTLNEKQKNLVDYIAGSILEQAAKKEDGDDEGGKEKMKHNAFDNSNNYSDDVLIHAEDQAQILATAKENGSFRRALRDYMDANSLKHDGDNLAPVSGFVQTGRGNVSYLFPEYKEVRPGAPELIKNDQGWVAEVINGVHKSPISRIRTSFVDIRNIESIRAKGYQKGKKKTLAGNFELIRRTTDPQTVYVKTALNRDDIVDITDFDYVQYLYGINREMLNEELATAIMIGDGRPDGDDKIYPDKIRPIWLDDDLYTIHVDIDLDKTTSEIQGTDTGANFGENFIYAESMVNAALYARENYKGTGTPDMYMTPHMVNVMLLARDRNGRRIYRDINELAAAFNVRKVITAEQFANKTRTTSDSKTKKLIALIANLNDYHLGATKGGEITQFNQFDIDFNQEKSLLETRVSGALTRVYSAIAIEEDVTTP